jgi:hypothetical protein
MGNHPKSRELGSLPLVVSVREPATGFWRRPGRLSVADLNQGGYSSGARSVNILHVEMSNLLD